jgi:hypothetical protein
VLIHRHIHSTDLLSHCITQESHLEFLINSSAQRRLIHHLHLCSHDDAPNTLGFHTFTLCSATGTSNSADRLSHCVTGESSGVLLNSLNGGGHLYVPALSQIGTTHPSQGLSLRFVSWRKSHIAAMIHISQVCKLENVSHSCNHQHSLSDREAFSTRPSLSHEILELFLGKWFGEDICNLFMSRKILHMYCLSLHHISDIRYLISMCFDLS